MTEPLRSKFLMAVSSPIIGDINERRLSTQNLWKDEYNTYNPLDLFSAGHPYAVTSALYSIGHQNMNSEMKLDKLKDRDTRIVKSFKADSGGFQISQGTIDLDFGDDEALKEQCLKYLKFIVKYYDYSPILDVPTFTLMGLEEPTGKDGKPPKDAELRKYKNYTELFYDNQQCLKWTNKLTGIWRDYIQENDIDFNFMNVVQGNTAEEVDEWLDGVAHFTEEGFTHGWCLSSACSDSVYYMVYATLQIVERGLVDKENVNTFHILGRSIPFVSTILSATAAHVLEKYGVQIQYTYDSSSYLQYANAGAFILDEHRDDLRFKISYTLRNYEDIKEEDLDKTIAEFYNLVDSEAGSHIKVREIFNQRDVEVEQLVDADDIMSTKKELVEARIWKWNPLAYTVAMIVNYETSVRCFNRAHDAWDNDDMNGALKSIKYTVLPDIFASDDPIATLAKHKHSLVHLIKKWHEPVKSSFETSGLFDW